MKTYEIPETLAAGLPERSVRRFCTYVPVATSMPLELWERARPDLLTLVADTEPTSDTDARTLLATACAFYGWATRTYGDDGLTALFTPERLAAFDASRAASRSPGSRQNERGRLNRCVRVLNGEAATTRRQPRVAAADPYLAPDLESLLAVARTSMSLTRVLAVALTTGKAAASGVGRALPDRADVDQALDRLGLSATERLELPYEAGTVLADGEWQLARRSATRVGLDIASDRLRVTWAIAVISEAAPVAHLVSAHGISRRDLDNAMPHVTVEDDGVARDLLRG